MDEQKVQTFVTNSDGSFTIDLDGKATRLVKESDLLVVKGGAERKDTEFQSQLAESNRQRDEEHSNLLKAQAAQEQFEKDSREGATHKLRVGELETELTTIKDNTKKLEDELLGRVKTSLTSGYGVKEEILKDKDFSQLRTMEVALNEAGVGSKPKAANYDSGPSGTGGITSPLTNLESCAAELTYAREIRSKKSKGDTDYTP